MAELALEPQQGSLFEQAAPRTPLHYYWGGQANPHLRDFVKSCLDNASFDPEPEMSVTEPLLVSSTVKRSTKIFNMHSYWSKKPHDSIKGFIQHFSREGDLVLDPFCGSGGTLLMAALGRRSAIGIDLSPAATFLSAALCAPPDIATFERQFQGIMGKLRSEYGWLYRLRFHGSMRDIHFGISSMVFECMRCLDRSSLYRAKDYGEGACCPKCGEPIKTTQQKYGYQLDEWHLLAERGSHDIYTVNGQIDDRERDTLERIRLELSNHKPPLLTFPKRARTQVLAVRGIETLTDLYTPRNLLALCLYRDACNLVTDERLRRSLLFVLTACCLKASRMMGLNSDGIGRIQKNGLIAQLIVKDINVFDFLEIAFRGIRDGFEEILAEAPENLNVMLSTQTATDLSAILDSSVDYIFTDPPYGERVQFWESNQVWEAWLELNTEWQKDELIVNRGRGFSEDHWRDVFSGAVRECRRVLKAGHWITLTYNDRDTWPILQDVMLGMGFIPDGSDRPVIMETTAKSEKQLKGEDNTLRDLVVSFRKPLIEEAGGIGVSEGQTGDRNFADRVFVLVRELLLVQPGISLETITDTVISQMVRRGELEQGRLSSYVRLVADEMPPGGNRWYLKDSETEQLEESESTREDAAAELLESFLQDRLTTAPGLLGLHFGELYEHFLYAVQDRDKPRRHPQEWLRDYFYVNDDGSYRPPDSDEEREAKHKERVKGSSYRIRRYVSALRQGISMPVNLRPNDATLAEWIRHCKRSGQYEQGKLLYEKGGLNLGALSEEAMVNVEEDYQVCVRMLARSAVATDSGPKGSTVRVRGRA